MCVCAGAYSPCVSVPGVKRIKSECACPMISGRGVSSGLGEKRRQAGERRRRRMETHMRQMRSDTVRSEGKISWKEEPLRREVMERHRTLKSLLIPYFLIKEEFTRPNVKEVIASR